MGTIAARTQPCSVTVTSRSSSFVAVAVVGELDLGSRAAVASAMAELVGGPPVRLDLSGVTFLDVAGYCALEEALTRTDPAVSLFATCAWFERIEALLQGAA